MAFRLWNQISSIKYLKHGTFRTYSHLGEKPYSSFTKKPSKSWMLRNTTVSGIRKLSESKESPPNAGTESEGRFVRTGFPPVKSGQIGLPEEIFRDAHHLRITHGIKRVREQAQDHLRTSCCMVTSYKLKDRSELAPDENLIKALKRSFVRRQTVARLQPQSVIPFCSKNVPTFEREDLRPRKITLKFRASKPDYSWMKSEKTEKKKQAQAFAFAKKPDEFENIIESDTTSIISDISSISEYPLQKQTAKVVAGPSTSTSKQVGHNFNLHKLNTTRQFSTFSQRSVDSPVDHPCFTQVRTLINKDCPGIEKKLPKDCCQPTREEKLAAKKNKYKHEGRWDRCECCPEMLPCDEVTCYNVYKFGCPTENYPTMCPIGCPPPCEPPPPPELPLLRPPKTPRYQKTKECKKKVCMKFCPFVPSKKLPQMPTGNCPCAEPFVPCELPKMKFAKKRVFQCTPCPPEECVNSCIDCVVPPKKLPPIIPGDCPCNEPKYTDVPPLRRLNLKSLQKVKECKSDCPKEEKIKCLITKRLPKIKSDCYCIEPTPLKPVKLVRLPPICLCPNPPDPKCADEECPIRADDVCKWEYPKKKLKDWWCPNCKLPKQKYKFCPCHTRGHKDCKKNKSSGCPKKPCVRCMSTLSSVPFNKGCSSLCLEENPLFTVRDFSAFSKRSATTSSTPMTLFNKSPALLPTLPSSGQLVAKRHFHGTITLNFNLTSPLERKKKKNPCKKKCVKICGTSCCDPAEKRECKSLPPLCCKPRKSPYPSFSECSEYHELLTCECKHTMPYLQPQMQVGTVADKIIEPTEPKYKIIDPILEEHCVLSELCRPYGYTYTCDNFHDGEPVPITQYECFSPHRIPCCERDQICNFESRPVEKTCEGIPKEPRYYRCQCICAPKKKCDDGSKKKFSTWGAANCARAFSTATNFMGPSTSTSSSLPSYTSTRLYSKKARGSGMYDCDKPKCPHTCKKKKRCGKPMRPSMRPSALPKCKVEDEDDNDEIGTRLKLHFRKGLDCTPKGRKQKLLEEAKCAAKRVGMKLVCEHSDCCKHKKPCPKFPQGKSPCKRKGECKRPKNVCCKCKPRWEVGQCKKRKEVAECCEMPYAMTGEEFRASQPPCCLMPIPACNRMCMRLRGSCKRENYVPCCVIESPFPAFSDCHPPFKRLNRTECQMQEILEDAAKRRIDKMIAQLRKYSTTASVNESPNQSFFERIAFLIKDSKPEVKGLHQPVDCKCASCVTKFTGIPDIKPDLRRNIKTELPSTDNDMISNIILTKEDIFKQVDEENLISLAPKDLTTTDKVKCYFFNKASNIGNNVGPIDKPVDGFRYFAPNTEVPSDSKVTTSGAVGSSRRYSVSKAEVIDDVAAGSAEENNQEATEVITLSEPSDLIYLMDDGRKAINVRPKPAPANKVKVMAHPVCTHIMLDSGELMLEQEYHLMNTILPLKDRLYLPYGLSHEEYVAIEEQNVKAVQNELEKLLEEKENA